MSRRNRGGKNRLETLRRSLESSRGGRLTPFGAELFMTGRLGGQPTECTITGHYHTFVFEFPDSYLISEKSVGHQVIYSHSGLKAAIVSDLPTYFEQEPAESLHYSIDVSLRASVHSIYEQAVEQANQQQPRPEVPLFVVIEEYADVSPTELSSHECFTIDECRDGEAIIEGGKEGKRALLAFPPSTGSWPDSHADMSIVNVVLAAVKVEQNVTNHIEELYSCSCLVSSEGQAVYTQNPTLSVSARLISHLVPPDLEEKADRIEAMLQGMMSDSEPAASELFDSILLDNTKDDSYLRLWYLRLWQALEDAKRHLGYPN